MRTRGRRSARVERRRQGRLSSPGVRPQQTPDRDAESLSVCGLRAEESGHAHRGRERRPVEAIRHTATDVVRGWHGAQLAWRRPRPSAARFASRPRRGGGLTGWGWRCATAMRRHPHHGSPLQEGLGLHAGRPARLATAVPRAKARSEELGRTDLSDALCHQSLVIVLVRCVHRPDLRGAPAACPWTLSNRDCTERQGSRRARQRERCYPPAAARGPLSAPTGALAPTIHPRPCRRLPLSRRCARRPLPPPVGTRTRTRSWARRPPLRIGGVGISSAARVVAPPPPPRAPSTLPIPLHAARFAQRPSPQRPVSPLPWLLPCLPCPRVAMGGVAGAAARALLPVALLLAVVTGATAWHWVNKSIWGAAAGCGWPTGGLLGGPSSLLGDCPTQCRHWFLGTPIACPPPPRRGHAPSAAAARTGTRRFAPTYRAVCGAGSGGCRRGQGRHL